MSQSYVFLSIVAKEFWYQEENLLRLPSWITCMPVLLLAKNEFRTYLSTSSLLKTTRPLTTSQPWFEECPSFERQYNYSRNFPLLCGLSHKKTESSLEFFQLPKIFLHSQSDRHQNIRATPTRWSSKAFCL